MNEQQQRFYEFGPFRLDAAGHQLFQGGERLTLARKACEVLVFMVQHAGETLSKDDFLKAIWADRFVEEGILTVHISALRKVLGENNGDDQYIVTVPRVGYRFVAKVQEVFENGNRSSSAKVLTDGNAIEQSVRVIGEKPAALHTVKHGVAFRIGLTVIAVLAVIGITALLFRSYLRAAPKLAEAGFQRTKFTRLTTSGVNPNAVISPDGKYLAYVVKANGKQSLWLRVVANSSDLQILPPEDAIYGGMAISPDSQTVYFDKTTNFASSSGIYQVPVLGGV